jgi:hypothetical protein
MPVATGYPRRRRTVRDVIRARVVFVVRVTL